MQMNSKEYDRYVRGLAAPSPMGKNLLLAFVVGGAICTVGQGIRDLWQSLGLAQNDAATATSISMIFLGALLTATGLYCRLARHAGAGTLVPITGFSNAVVSPAIEFKSENWFNGVGSKMFIVAGPVIVYGVTASVIYGIILVLLRHL